MQCLAAFYVLIHTPNASPCTFQVVADNEPITSCVSAAGIIIDSNQLTEAIKQSIDLFVSVYLTTESSQV